MSRLAMRPDSRNSRVLRALLEESRRIERGVRLDELLSAYNQRHAPITSKQLACSLNSLGKRGLVLKAGGRLQRTLWVHADASYRCGDDADPARAICNAVANTAKSRGEALTTAEVHQALVASGVEHLSVDQVRTKLRTLSYSSPTKEARAHPDWKQPQIREIVRVSRGGRRALFWAPIEGTYRTPEFLDRSDAIHFAIADAEKRLGCPVTKENVRVWAHPASAGEFGAAARGASAAVLDEGFAGAVGNAASGSTIRTIRTRWTSRGDYPPRFSVLDAVPSHHAVCVVEDLAVFLRPADETASIAALREEAAELGCRDSETMAAVRAHLLTEQVRHLLGSAQPHIREAVQSAVSARQTLLRWTAAADLQAWREERLHEELAREMEQLTALEEVATLPSTRSSPGDSLPLGIGDTQGHPFAHFEDLATEANSIAGSQAVHWQNQLAGVRRIRGARAAGRAAATDPVNHAWIDRPDAIATIVRSCYLPELTAWVAGAEAVMGQVLRDPRWLCGYLERLPLEASALRQHLTVALGLLGSPPPLSLACPMPTDVDDLGAYLVSVALGIDDLDERIRLIEDADLYAQGAAMEATDMALARIEGGARLAILG